MLRLWRRRSSINVRKVAWTLRELGVPHERRDGGGAFGIVDTPAYRAHNPNGLVPLIEDGDFVLRESNVCKAHRWFNLPQERTPWPNVERWYRTLRARPATDTVLDQPLQ